MVQKAIFVPTKISKPMRPVFQILALCLFFTLPIAAQQSAGFFEYIGVKDGLSHSDVLSLFRDSRGFLWIGTVNGGLNRYDGHEMKVYRHRDSDSLSLCEDIVYSILEDEQGFIWVGTNGGISCLNPTSGKCRNFTKQNGHLAYNGENRLFKDAQGRLWTANGGLERYDPDAGRFIRFPSIDTLHLGGTAAADREGRFWVGGHRGLKRIDTADKEIRIFLPFRREDLREINGAKIDRYGNIWVCTWGGGLLRFHPETGQFERFLWGPETPFTSNSNIVFDIAETFDLVGKHYFWIATEDGIYKFALGPEGFPSLDVPHDFYNNLPCGQVRVLYADGQGNLWAGGPGGLCRYSVRQENFRTFRKIVPGGMENINFTAAGDALVSFPGEPPCAIFDADLRPREMKISLPPKKLFPERDISWDMVKDEESGLMYVATFEGLLAYNEKTGATRWFLKKDGDSTGLVAHKVTNILPLGGGKLLLATWGLGMQVFDANTGQNLKYLGKYALIVRRLKKLPNGEIWVCAESNLMKFDPVRQELEYVTPNPVLMYYDILIDVQGRCWLATDQGLFLFDRQTHRLLEHYGTEEGLPHKFIDRFCEDGRGRIWLFTQKGLCYFDPDMKRCTRLGLSDGILNADLGGGLVQGPDGHFWLAFGTDLQIFRPELVETPRPSQCYITGLKINEKDSILDRPFEHIAEIRLLPGQNALTFNYTAADLETFGKTSFLYRLEGLQSDWVHAGKDRTARFINLPAGEYVFRVRPEDAGDDDSTDAVLRIVVTNHFWERAWFINLAMLTGMLLALGMVTYYYRSRLRLREAEAERLKAIEATRSQIAQDIHDDLGTELSKISIGARVAAMMPELDGDALREKLQAIGADAQAVAQHLRDVVFIANPRFDAFSEVQAYFREKSREFLERVGLEPHFDFPKPEHDPPVRPEVKRQLFLLLRECLNNTARHAGATELFFRFELVPGADKPAGDSYLFDIRDNGSGFDPGDTRPFGNGLSGMSARAEKIGAQLTLDTAPGKGTSIRLTGPL